MWSQIAACSAMTQSVAAGAATGKRRRASSGSPQASAKRVSSQGEPWTSSSSQASRIAMTIKSATSASMAWRATRPRILMG